MCRIAWGQGWPAKDRRTEEGYVIAAPRIIDGHLLERTMTEIGACMEREDAGRAVELLAHVVPEYRREPAGQEAGAQALPSPPSSATAHRASETP